MSPPQIDPDPRVQSSPVAPVRVDTILALPEASSATIEDPPGGFQNAPTPPAPVAIGGRVNEEDSEMALPPRRDPVPRARAGQHTPVSSGSWSVVDAQTGVGTVGTPGEQPSSSHHGEPRATAPEGSSQGSIVSTAETFEDFEPLHYHHQPYQTSKRASKSPDNGAGSGSGNRLNVTRSGIYRPASVYSLMSDRQSPQLSPYLKPRNSPDARPVSFVDLLNTPYPQPAPAPAQSGTTAHLRSSLGNYASLLSHQQTFNMYLANVKKTDDPAVQYEFAVFLVNSMHEMPPEELHDGSTSGDTETDSEITRARLLKEAKSILQRLADRSYPFAQYYLGDGYASGLFGKNVDYGRAFTLFLAASKHGHVEACYRTALCYEFGWGCRIDAARAEKFYRYAASKNHPGAMLRMAKACLAGHMGLGKRYREGVKWLKRAADSADIQYNSGPYELGLLHETGFGDDVFPDPSYAAQLFTKSADLGNFEASFRMGDAYEHGKLNCPRDPALSIHFYTGAAQGGHPLAMMALCAWYLVGAEPVLEKDEGEAYEWAKRAAELGLAKAQYAVGYFTEMGIGCRRDPLEANVWYVKAADQGDERAIHRLAAIRAAAEGANPKRAAAGAVARYRKQKEENAAGKSKRFGLF